MAKIRLGRLAARVATTATAGGGWPGASQGARRAPVTTSAPRTRPSRAVFRRQTWRQSARPARPAAPAAAAPGTPTAASAADPGGEDAMEEGDQEGHAHERR